MSFLAWIVLGLIAGFIGSKLVNKTGEGVSRDIVLGIAGAVVGGYLFSMFGAHGVQLFSPQAPEWESLECASVCGIFTAIWLSNRTVPVRGFAHEAHHRGQV